MQDFILGFMGIWKYVNSVAAFHYFDASLLFAGTARYLILMQNVLCGVKTWF